MTSIEPNIPRDYEGDWCDRDVAHDVLENDFGDSEELASVANPAIQWAHALLRGDIHSAHKLWGKWQGYAGNDPWEDPGWRLFWEVQRFGEHLWEDFDAAEVDERAYFTTFISIWPEADSV